MIGHPAAQPVVSSAIIYARKGGYDGYDAAVPDIWFNAGARRLPELARVSPAHASGWRTRKDSNLQPPDS